VTGEDKAKFKVNIETPINDVPIDMVILSLTGFTKSQLVSDIVKNTNGKWNFLFDE
jgi:hypothetical protein